MPALTVGQTFPAIRTMDVVMLLPDAARISRRSLPHLMIDKRRGPDTPSQMASIVPTEDRYKIEHDGGQRLVLVTFNAGAGSLQGTVDEAQKAIADSVALPPGVFVEFTGAAEAEQART